MSEHGKQDHTASPAIDRQENATGIGRLIMLGLALSVVALVAYVYGGDRFGEPVMLVILGFLVWLGVFFLFALVLGFVRLTSETRAKDFSKKLVNDMDAGLIVTDHEGKIIYANEAYAKLLGAEDETDIESVESVFSKRPEATDVIYRLANSARNGSPVVEEFRLSNGLKTGQEGARWFRTRARTMQVDGYKRPLNVWQVSDVTADRRQQETAFQELQDAIHYLDHAPAGFMASETSGALVYINATLADWLGIDLARFRPGSINIADLVLGDGMAMLEAVKSDNGQAKTAIIDLDLAKSDGTRLPVRLYHRVQFTQDGAPGSTRTLVINRGAAHGDSDALRNAEVRFVRFFNNTPVAIAAANANGDIIRTNAPFLRMFDAAIDKHSHDGRMRFTKIVAKDDRQPLKEAFTQALAGQGEIAPVDLAINGGGDRYVRLFVSPVTDMGIGTDDEGNTHDGGDDIERVIFYAMETTEQRALEAQFAQGQKMQAVGQLAGGVAHDFNNVLTAIIGFSDLLLANHKPSDPSFQDIMNIKQNANRAASLVRQLLAFSRRQTLRPQVLHMADVLSDVRILLERLIGEKVELDIRHGRDLWPIKADLSQFEQVIVNLCVNARDAMPDGGKIAIQTSNVTAEECARRFEYKEMPAAEYVLLEVADEGTGMPPEVLEKIFEPFFSTKEVGKGTGLGLATVYGIIKQTGGFIYPESEEGKGTTFRIFLPRHELTQAEQEAGNPVEGEAKERGRDLTGNATILLVEDEDAVRAFSSRALTSRGYIVHEASSGVEALEVMEEHGEDIDLVVSDVVMPEMDGPTLLGNLRKDYPDLKFIFVSGYAEEAFAKNLPEEERDKFGFLAKPFSLKQLATTVKEMLNS